MENATRVEFRILGPLEVVAGGEPLEIAGRQQQALLVLLLIHANEILSPERLIDALWGPAPPATAAASLRVSVSKLRRVLDAVGAADLLRTEARGYVLRVDPSQTDIARFETLVASALRSADPVQRAALLEDALSGWRGPPTDGLEYDEFAQSELKRLEELRVLALEERAECELELGRHRELVPELEAFVASEPLRERRHGQLMRALARSGRQAEALEVYRGLRKRLVEELGLEPSVELRELERSILRQDEVEPTSELAPAPISPPRAPSRRLPAVAAAVLGASIVAAGAIALLGREDEPAPRSLGSVARLHAQSGAVVGQLPIRAQVKVGDGFGTVVVTSDDVWVRNTIDQTVSRVDLVRETVTATTRVGAGSGGDLAFAGGDLWATNAGENSVSRIDGKTGKVVATIPVGLLPQGIAAADGDIWVANHRGVPNLSAVVRIDPTRNAIEATVPVPDGGVCGKLAATADAVWVASGFCGEGALTRIDPRANRVVARIRSPRWNTVFAMNPGFGSLWFGTDAGPFELDPVTNRVVSRLAKAGDVVFGGDMAAGAGSLWIHDARGQMLLRIDPSDS